MMVERPTGTLQLAAIAECCAAPAVAEAAAGALRLAQLRAEMAAGLASVGAEVVDGRAPFILFRRPDAAAPFVFQPVADQGNGFAQKRAGAASRAASHVPGVPGAHSSVAT